MSFPRYIIAENISFCGDKIIPSLTMYIIYTLKAGLYSSTHTIDVEHGLQKSKIQLDGISYKNLIEGWNKYNIQLRSFNTFDTIKEYYFADIL